MLVVAPHQDDEAIGCGGVLALQLRSGNAAAVVMLHDGADEHDEVGMSRPALMELRKRRISEIGCDHWSGISKISQSRPPCRQRGAGLRRGARHRHRAKDRCEIRNHSFLNAHPDHRTANNIVAEALKGISTNVRVFGYEVWGLCIPNILVVIDDVIEEKLQMLSCFTFANKALDYVHSTGGVKYVPFANAGRWRMPICRAIL